MMRFTIATLFIAALAVSAVTASAETMMPYSGTQSVTTGQPFGAFLEGLKAAIQKNKMGLVSEASTTKGAAKIGKTIAGNHVLMIFRPDFAVCMLEASVASGVEAPLRLYVTEGADGNATLTYRLPSHVFAAYDVPALDEMAKELDATFAAIVADATM